MMMSLSELIKRLLGDPPPRRNREPDAKSSSRPQVNPWHAVSIVPCDRACASAEQAVGTRYLSKQAPTLPLEGCTTAGCECRYRHHGDRRQALRRSADVWSGRGGWIGSERRETRGRRMSDLA